MLGVIMQVIVAKLAFNLSSEYLAALPLQNHQLHTYQGGLRRGNKA